MKKDYTGMRPYDVIECRCKNCKEKETCIHRDCYRRLPREIGGLGLCPNLKK